LRDVRTARHEPVLRSRRPAEGALEAVLLPAQEDGFELRRRRRAERRAPIPEAPAAQLGRGDTGEKRQAIVDAKLRIQAFVAGERRKPRRR
jgi:hypothetical protein